MKISNVEIWQESFNLTRPYTIAFRTVSHVKNIFVQLQTDNGLTALGCGSPEPHVTGETFEQCETALNQFNFDELKRLEISKENERPIFALLEQNLSSTPAARAAVDIAIYDLLAQDQKTPLCQFLGQKHHKLLTSITIGIKPIDEVLLEASEYRDRNFKIIKLKLGKDLESDIERTVKLHEHVGRDMKVRVDLNQGYSLGDLKTYLDATSSCEVEFCEQPIAADKFDDITQLSETYRSKIAADESLLSPADAQHLAEIDACGVFNIKLMKCGGIFPALGISQHAATKGIELMWGCMDESRVSIGAALHAAFSCEGTRYLDLDGHLDLGRDLVEGGFSIDNGWMSVGQTPGIGYHRL